MGSIDDWAKARGQQPPLHPETEKNTTPKPITRPEPEKRSFIDYISEKLNNMSYFLVIIFVAIIVFGGGGFYFGYTKTTRTEVIEKIKEIPVEKIVERKIKVPVEKIKYVDKIVEKLVEVPVEKIKYIDKVKYVDRVVTKSDSVLQAKYKHLLDENSRLKNRLGGHVELIDKFFNNPLPAGQKRKLTWNKCQCDCPAQFASY